MKFGEDLERVKGTSDPEWVPYWPNYGILKRLIKGLPQKQKTACFRANVVADSKSSSNNQGQDDGSNHTVQESQSRVQSKEESRVNDVTAKNPSSKATHQYQILKRERGEVIFFKLLHAEVHKATHFFQETQENYAARARLLSTEMAAIDRMQKDQQQLLLQKIFWLHQQLLRLEVFAIMSYCAFSKILKKHDKVTGFNTKAAFMEKIVNLTCITHTPRVQAMIEQCQEWMAHPKLVQERVVSSSDCSPEEEQKPSKDDQKLFLETIKQLNNDEKKKESKTTTCSNNKSSSSDAHRDSLVSILSTVCKNSSNSATNWFQAVSSSSSPQQPERQQKTILRQVSESACSVASTSSDEEGELEARECASSSGKRQMDEYGSCPFPKRTKLGATRAQ